MIFATHNQHKLAEVRAILGEHVEVESLASLGFEGEIPETGSTLRQNALQKAEFVHQHFGCDCFADDTGLEVDALDGEPGVFSARYAGEPTDFARNRQKLLTKLDGKTNRKARFRTVVALIVNGETHFFEGKIEGHIADSETGEGGFGYDSIFVPCGYDKTFAELPAEVKNNISHRAEAMQKLANWLSLH